MIKKCEYCGAHFFAKRSHAKYCSAHCLKKAYCEREAKREERPANQAIRSFTCAHCGRQVYIFDKADARYVYCSGVCYLKAKERRKAAKRQRVRGNLGMSGGMSLGSLIRRGARDLD